MFRKTLATLSLTVFLIGGAAASLQLEPCIDGGVSPDGLSTQTGTAESS